MSEYDTFVSALRTSFKGMSGEPDMRATAREALRLLDHDKVLLAATTHLTQLARREWNRIVTEHGEPAPNSDEVVNVHGSDVFLGDTSPDDREWLAQHRERLAAGLDARAEQFRTMGASGPALVTLTTRDVLRAERLAAEREALADALERLITVGESGRSALEDRMQHDIEAARRREEEARQTVESYMNLARRIVSVEWIQPHAREAVVDLAGSLDITSGVNT